MSVLFTRRGAAPSLGKLASDYAVGDTVKIPVNGSNKDFLVVHQGLPSSDYDSSCNGTWVLMNDIYEERAVDSTYVGHEGDNDYENSEIYSYLSGTFIGLLGTSAQSAIKQIKIPYWSGTGYSGSYKKGSNGLSSKVFLLSDREVGFSSSLHSRFPNIGSVLAYFKNGDEKDQYLPRRAKFDGSYSDWWLRAPTVGVIDYVWKVDYTGSWNNSASQMSRGIRPCFVIKPDTMFDRNDVIK